MKIKIQGVGLMTLQELREYYANIPRCYGNCNCCEHYNLCDLIVELIENEDEEAIEELTEEDLNRL